MEIQQLSLQEIQDNFPYRYHYDSEPEALVRSVQMQGVLQPVWLAGRTLLDGHRRLLAARRAGAAHLPALVFDEAMAEERFLAALHLNSVSAGLSMMEKIRACFRAAEAISRSTGRKAAGFLGLARIPRISRTAAQLLELPDWMQYYFHEQDLSLRQMQGLLKYPLPEYEKWLRFAAELALKGRELSGLLEQVRDICLRDDLPAPEVWESLGLAALQRSLLTPQQKIQHLKQRVNRERYRLLTRIREIVSEDVKRIEKDFPGSLAIQWDKSLERPGILLNIRVQDAADAEEVLKYFEKQQFAQRLKTVLENMNRLPEEEP